MSKTRKITNTQAAETVNENDLLHRQGLYSGCSITAAGSASGPLSKLALAVYAPALISIWIFCYVILGMGIIPFTHGPVSTLALVISCLAAPAVFMLLWPADRTASMVLALMILDFWVWVVGRPYEGLLAHIFVLIDIAGFSALLFCVYMYVYR